MTRVLAVADTTENWTSETIAAARTVDVILSLGDMYRVDLELLDGGAPLLGVHVNHCSPNYLRDTGAFELSPSHAPVAFSTLNNGMTILGLTSSPPLRTGIPILTNEVSCFTDDCMNGLHPSMSNTVSTGENR